MNKKFNFLILLSALLLSTSSLEAQISLGNSHGVFAKTYNNFYFSQYPFTSLSLYNKNIPSPDFATTRSMVKGPFVPNTYNYHNLAFFCKLEVKMEKKAKLPIKVRLGDIDYVDWLEGKRERY